MSDEALGKVIYSPSNATDQERLNVFLGLVDYWLVELRRVGVTRQILWEEYGQENPDDSQVCRSCGAVLISPPIQAPGLSIKTSGMAIAALVLGILSICG